MSARKPDEAAPSAADLRLLVERAKKAEDKRESRARLAKERATAALAPNPTGYVVPPMPAGLAAIRKWQRAQHDAYSRRDITPLELNEIRSSSRTQAELYKASAELRKAEAAQRAAEAQERMAEALAAVEHGGAAVMLLSRLQESLAAGKPRRPLPYTPGAPRVLPQREPGA